MHSAQHSIVHVYRTGSVEVKVCIAYTFPYCYAFIMYEYPGCCIYVHAGDAVGNRFLIAHLSWLTTSKLKWVKNSFISHWISIYLGSYFSRNESFAQSSILEQKSLSESSHFSSSVFTLTIALSFSSSYALCTFIMICTQNVYGNFRYNVQILPARPYSSPTNPHSHNFSADRWFLCFQKFISYNNRVLKKTEVQFCIKKDIFNRKYFLRSQHWLEISPPC